MLGRLGIHRRIGEDALHRRLGVVKVAANGHRVDIRLARRRHLKALDARCARRRIEDLYFRTLDTGEPLHRGRTRVAARGRQHQDAPPARRVLHQNRQHRKRDILERPRPTVEEFKDMEAVLLDQRNRILRGETREQAVNRRLPNRLRQIVKQLAQHIGLTRRKRRQSRNVTRLNPGHPRHVKSAIRRKTLKNALGTRRLEPLAR